MTRNDIALYNEKTNALDLHFHQGQWDAWESDKRFTFVLAGTQGGKTSFGPHWLYREIYDPHIGKGSGDYLAVTASYDLFKLKMLPSLRELFENTLGMGRYWAGDKVIELRDPITARFHANRQDDPMWGRVILRSARSGGGLEAATALAAWLDECGMDDFVAQTWQAVLRRLSLARGRVLGTTTLYVLYNWLKDLYNQWRNGRKDITFVQFPSYINPAFPKEEYDNAVSRLPGHVVNMFYRGLYDKPPGMIYDAYDDAVCTIDPMPIPKQWPYYGGLDFGGPNLVALRVAHDIDNDDFYVTDEYHPGSNEIGEHAKELKRWGCKAWFGGAPSEGQWRSEFGANGMPVQKPLISDLWLGINRVYGLHKQKRIYIFRTCERVLSEIGTYSRKMSKATGEPTDDIVNKNDYHFLDAKRYLCSYLGRDIDTKMPKQPERPSRWKVDKVERNSGGRWKKY